MEEKVKILSEIEGKEYLLKIEEDKNHKLEKIIKKYEAFLAISTITIFPLALMGLLSVASWENLKLLIFVIVFSGIFFGVIYLLRLLLIKIKKDHVQEYLEKIKK